MTSGTKERVELLSKLADSWIRLGQTGEGLRTDEYVNKHREAIMGIYEYCGKSLKEYLNYEPVLAAVEREGAQSLAIAKAHLEEATNWHQYGPKHDEDGWCCQRENELRNEIMELERTAQSPVAREGQT